MTTDYSLNWFLENYILLHTFFILLINVDKIILNSILKIMVGGCRLNHLTQEMDQWQTSINTSIYFWFL
jgi:hypothetical protein